MISCIGLERIYHICIFYSYSKVSKYIYIMHIALLKCIHDSGAWKNLHPNKDSNEKT